MIWCEDWQLRGADPVAGTLDLPFYHTDLPHRSLGRRQRFSGWLTCVTISHNSHRDQPPHNSNWVATEAGDEQKIIHWVGKQPGSAGCGKQLCDCCFVLLLSKIRTYRWFMHMLLPQETKQSVGESELFHKLLFSCRSLNGVNGVRSLQSTEDIFIFSSKAQFQDIKQMLMSFTALRNTLYKD